MSLILRSLHTGGTANLPSFHHSLLIVRASNQDRGSDTSRLSAHATDPLSTAPQTPAMLQLPKYLSQTGPACDLDEDTDCQPAGR
eukprot:296153-Hanusia_phi.AAC.2